MYGGGQQPGYGVQAPGAHPAPPDPYGAAPMSATRATLQGSAGVFTVVPGVEIRAGRDGAQCGILLAEPRVSGVHSTLKLESGQLLVRDEHSNNGTLLNGNRLTPGVWTPVPNGSLVRFGPVEFSVRLE
jgi:pSer/pThr/pTyr-binding forkhead associated (FHA) protein